MTLKEFSLKYDIPYGIVYESSCKLSSYATLRRDREYDEDDIRQAVLRLVKGRIKRHRDIALKHKGYFDSLRR